MGNDLQSWSKFAYAHIEKRYRERRAEDADMPDAAMMKLISRADYPFHGRENWPYKAWLNQIKRFRLKLAGYVKPGKTKTPNPDQWSLFE